ncbi:MAG: DMT family transporter [Eubacteriaceae bacterium]|nr:DMT family transporter [Eubacteriaceae bacterium]
MKNIRAYIYPTITFMLWGSLYVISKPAMEHVPPVTLLFLRYLLASVILFFIVKNRFHKLPKVKKEHRMLFLVVGFLGYGLAIAFQQIGNDMLDASMAALINSMNPVFIFVMAFLILKEKITGPKIIGVLMSIGGVYIILGASSGDVNAAGLLISLGSVFFWSLSSILVRSISAHYDPVVITFYGIALSLILLAPSSLIEVHFRSCSFTPSVIISILYLAIFATALAHVLWNKGLQMASAGTCSLFYPVQPLTSSILGIVVLHEAMSVSFIAGAVIISAGIIISLLKPPFKGRLSES